MATTEAYRATNTGSTWSRSRMAQARAIGAILVLFACSLVGVLIFLVASGQILIPWEGLALGFLLGFAVASAVMTLGSLGLRPRWPAPRNY